MFDDLSKLIDEKVFDFERIMNDQLAAKILCALIARSDGVPDKDAYIALAFDTAEAFRVEARIRNPLPPKAAPPAVCLHENVIVDGDVTVCVGCRKIIDVPRPQLGDGGK